MLNTADIVNAFYFRLFDNQSVKEQLEIQKHLINDDILSFFGRNWRSEDRRLSLEEVKAVAVLSKDLPDFFVRLEEEKAKNNK